jgi:PAS domain S-box-containing protein
MSALPAEQLLEVLRGISDGYSLIDCDGRIVFANGRAAELLGVKPDDLIGRIESELLEGRYAGPFVDASRKAREDCAPVEARVCALLSGRKLNVRMSRVGSLVAVLLRPAPAALQQASGTSCKDWWVPVASPATEVGLAYIGLDGQWLGANLGVGDMLGCLHEDLQGRNLREFCLPQDFKAVRVAARRILQSEAASYSLTARLCRCDGSVLLAQVTLFLARDTDGKPSFYVLALEDIGKRERSIERLRRSEERFRLFVQNAPVAVVMLDREMRFLAASGRYLRDYGLDEPIIGRILYEVVPDMPEPWKERHRRCLAGAVERVEEDRFDRADGTSHWVRHETGPWYDADGEIGGIIVFLEIITEHKRLEAQLLQSHKLDSIGRLAGGVAHDFNNLLTAILGYAEMAQEECEPDSPLQDHLRNVIQPAQSAARLTQQLLAFARRQVIVPEVADVRELVFAMGKMLRRLVPENIELEILPDEELYRVKVDTGQFEQIIVNLVVNARDAMPDGGTITISARNVRIGSKAARALGDLVPGSYVGLTVSDTGGGVPEALRQRIFEPFFSTKERGRGTGLGLATVYGIVRQSGGYVWVSGEPGLGATFNVYLPRTLDAPERARPAPLGRDRPGGNETILFVEDEAPVRSLAVAVLRGQGYMVLEAADGKEALEIADGREKDISLVVSDVIMPRMGGREMAERLQSTHPGLGVLFCSGYAEEGILPEGAPGDGIAFLPKPFTPSGLLRRVRELLDERDAASLARAA